MPPIRSKTEEMKKPSPKFAVGFIDDKTMVIGFEKTVTAFLNRDANYKNQKTLEMLSSNQNSLFAFAVNSNVAQKAMSRKCPKRPPLILRPAR